MCFSFQGFHRSQCRTHPAPQFFWWWTEWCHRPTLPANHVRRISLASATPRTIQLRGHPGVGLNKVVAHVDERKPAYHFRWPVWISASNFLRQLLREFGICLQHVNQFINARAHLTKLIAALAFVLFRQNPFDTKVKGVAAYRSMVLPRCVRTTWRTSRPSTRLFRQRNNRCKDALAGLQVPASSILMISATGCPNGSPTGHYALIAIVARNPALPLPSAASTGFFGAGVLGHQAAFSCEKQWQKQVYFFVDKSGCAE